MRTRNVHQQKLESEQVTTGYPSPILGSNSTSCWQTEGFRTADMRVPGSGRTLAFSTVFRFLITGAILSLAVAEAEQIVQSRYSELRKAES